MSKIREDMDWLKWHTTKSKWSHRPIMVAHFQGQDEGLRATNGHWRLMGLNADYIHIYM